MSEEKLAAKVNSILMPGPVIDPEPLMPGAPIKAQETDKGVRDATKYI